MTIALGSNQGDSPTLLATARELIAAEIGPLLHASSILTTKAWGVTDQPDFLNQVVVAEVPDAFPITREYLHGFLDRTQSIEQRLGRLRKTHWGPRTVDLDLIFLDDVRWEDERLSLPHPWWGMREFVGGILRGELPAVLLRAGISI